MVHAGLSCYEDAVFFVVSLCVRVGSCPLKYVVLSVALECVAPFHVIYDLFTSCLSVHSRVTMEATHSDCCLNVDLIEQYGKR